MSDSAKPPATAYTNLSITVVAGPLSVTTTSLPNGTVDTAYSQDLQATEGVPPYTWSVTAGSLPQVLALNSGAGTISGATAKAGTSNFTVQVADSATPPVTARQALSITVTKGSSPDDSKLKGHYAFLFNGFDDATGSGVAVAASFTADEAGNITNGIEDVNGPGSAHGTGEIPYPGT